MIRTNSGTSSGTSEKTGPTEKVSIQCDPECTPHDISSISTEKLVHSSVLFFLLYTSTTPFNNTSSPTLAVSIHNSNPKTRRIVAALQKPLALNHQQQQNTPQPLVDTQRNTRPTKPSLLSWSLSPNIHLCGGKYMYSKKALRRRLETTPTRTTTTDERRQKTVLPKGSKTVAKDFP